MHFLVEEQLSYHNIDVMQTVDPKLVHLTKPPSLWTKLGKIAHEKHLCHKHTCAFEPLVKILLHLH